MISWWLLVINGPMKGCTFYDGIEPPDGGLRKVIVGGVHRDGDYYSDGWCVTFVRK